MKILALDVTSEFGSIALLDGAKLIEQVAVHSPEGFAHVLFQEIEALLALHGWTIADVEGFAATSGPGAFTGVRVGLTVVKGLAEACGRKVVAVSNLRALACFGSAELRAAVLDARRGDVYGGVYDSSGRAVQDEVVTKLETWLAGLPAGAEIVAQGIELERPYTRAPREIAAAVGRIAAEEFAEGGGKDPAEIDANYVRRSDAELFWRE